MIWMIIGINPIGAKNKVDAWKVFTKLRKGWKCHFIKSML